MLVAILKTPSVKNVQGFATKLPDFWMPSMTATIQIRVILEERDDHELYSRARITNKIYISFEKENRQFNYIFVAEDKTLEY